AVRYFGSRYQVMAPNVVPSTCWLEMDLLGIRRSGYVDEIEIKLDRADFKADFKKRVPSNPRCHGLKHDVLAAGDGLPNYFAFAVPEGLVEPGEVPDYAGLYYVTVEAFA